MKKQLAIVTRKMITGGVERALIGMLKAVDYSSVDIDLYVQELGGELESELPPEVNIIQLPTVSSNDIWKYPFRCIQKAIILKRLQNPKWSFEEQCYLSSRMLLPLRKQYDIAISYHAPNTVPVFYVIDGICAKKKILWLHGDMENNAGNSSVLMTYHSQFNSVYAVSKSVYDSFVKLHPDMQDRTELFFNLVDEKGIWEKAENAPTYQDRFSGFRLLTIGRLAEQKGIDIAIDACQIVLDKGYNVRWYVCGEGEDYPVLLDRVGTRHIENAFVFLGNQPNPYGFLRDCDYYVQTSRYEGYCTTTNEARIMHKVVITTDVSGAREQFEDGVTGYIVPIEAEAIADKIMWCIDHLEEDREVEKRLKDMDFFDYKDVTKVFCL